MKNSEAKNNKVIKVIEEIKKTGVKVLRDKEWKCYMPSPSILKTILHSSNTIILNCYDLSSVLSKRHTFVLSNTRELDRVPKYKHLPYIQTTNGLCYTSLALS